MKQLILLRHGEAGFSQGSDFQRQLTTKGKENLLRLGKSIKNELISIDLMYCSPATRTMETAELIKNYIEIKEAVFTRVIYEGDTDKLVALLEKTPADVNKCLLVGHNPAISLLLAYLTNDNYLGLHPGMMATVHLECEDWPLICRGSGSLSEINQ